MEAIQLTNANSFRAYTCSGIGLSPDPPRAGEKTSILLDLKNPGPQPVTIHRLEFMVAVFGMGVKWERLPSVENVVLPADPRHVERIEVEWVPATTGHRCISATLETDMQPRPSISLRRNVQVINAEEDQTRWHVPFRLGNPEDERAAILLKFGAEEIDDGLGARVIVKGKQVFPRLPFWLEAKEEVDASLLLYARTDEAIRSVKTLEAYSGERFIDGIQIEVARPVLVRQTGYRLQGRKSNPINEFSEPFVTQSLKFQDGVLL